MSVRFAVICILTVALSADSVRLAIDKRIRTSKEKPPWSLEVERLPEGFEPTPESKEVADFGGSLRKALEHMEKVLQDAAPDPFPLLDRFLAFSKNKNRWYAFSRDHSFREQLLPLPLEDSAILPQVGSTSKQVIITVQDSPPEPYCLAGAVERINCAITWETRGGKQVDTAGTWVVASPEPNMNETVMDLTEKFGASVGNAITSLLKDNGMDITEKTFIVRSRSSGETKQFKRRDVSVAERVAFAQNYKGKRYPDHVCPGGKGHSDIIPNIVFPFPGASAWVLQSKWVSQGKPIESSPLFDMEDNWSNAIRQLNDDSGRVRIYFVGHSAARKDFFGSRTGRHYDSKSMAKKLIDAGMSPGKDITISFQACNAAKVFCPALAEQFQEKGYRRVLLYCREPEAARYQGGDFRKRVLVAFQKTMRPRPVHQAPGSKTVFFTNTEHPRQGYLVY